MNKHMSANTLRFQDVNLGQEGLMKMDNAGMVIPECAYFSRQEGVKRGIIVISTTEERETATGHQIHISKGLKMGIFPMISMETEQTIQMLGP